MADVFISYHEKSAGELAQRIANALDAAGISCWCARRDMPPGGNFARHIPQQIRDCRLFLLILNENMYQSLDMENELGMAFQRYKNREAITILPLEIGDFTRKDWVEYYLFHIQSVRMPRTDDAHIQELVQTVARIPHIEPSQLAQPSGRIIDKGSCGKNVAYTLDANGVLVISGNGPIIYLSPLAVFQAGLNALPEILAFTIFLLTLPICMLLVIIENFYPRPWSNHAEQISRVVVESGVTGIETQAFRGCKNLTSVDISDSVTSIGSNAFRDCRSLTNVDIPDSVTSIGSNAFRDCHSLASVSVPRKATCAADAFPAHTTVISRP